MKRLVMCIVLLVAVSCSKAGPLQLCEGMEPSGAGTKCGTKFITGDVTGVLTLKEPLGVSSLDYQISEKGSGNPTVRERVSFEVDPASPRASVLIPLYEEGTFTITIIKGTEVVADATVEMVDE
jgi:hypothetical protein